MHVKFNYIDFFLFHFKRNKFSIKIFNFFFYFLNIDLKSYKLYKFIMFNYK